MHPRDRKQRRSQTRVEAKAKLSAETTARARHSAETTARAKLSAKSQVSRSKPLLTKTWSPTKNPRSTL